jgi:hypothetical protein
MPRTKSKSVKKEINIVINEFLEDGEMFQDEEKFWEEMNGIKKKIVEEEEGKKKVEKGKEKEEKIEKEEKMEKMRKRWKWK